MEASNPGRGDSRCGGGRNLVVAEIRQQDSLPSIALCLAETGPQAEHAPSGGHGATAVGGEVFIRCWKRGVEHIE
jgi:hypothetical protein